jgi:phage shock protein PspC (stress-responsive transcriptional regulator)
MEEHIRRIGKKKLYRSDDKILAGVCSGIAEYFEIDPTIVRVLYILATVFTGFVAGIFGYLICWMIIPVRD